MNDLYNTIAELLSEKGITGYKMCQDLRISRSFMTELKKGRVKSMKAETAQMVADYFGVSVDYLLTGEEKEKAPIDVVDEDLRDYLDELRNRPEMRMLFSTTKTATKAQIEAIVKMVEEMQGDK